VDGRVTSVDKNIENVRLTFRQVASFLKCVHLFVKSSVISDFLDHYEIERTLNSGNVSLDVPNR
jgi:hypothetical protein